MNNFASEFNVLIVDDISTNITLVHTILKKEGYSLLTATSGAEALDLSQKHHPNLILLDIMMPEMDGYEVLRRLKSNPDTTDIPVMIMSALSEFQNIVKGYQLGAIEYITKPFNRDELVKRVYQRFELFYVARMKNELQRAVESREMLFSLVTHDLRTPIGSMRMVNQSLLQQVKEEQVSSEAYGLLLELNKKTEETSLLLDNMLKLARNEQKKQRPYRQYADLNNLLNRVIEIYQPIAKLKNIAFIRENLEKELMVFIDIDMIKVVIRNLFSNAVKFSLENEKIQVSSHITDENIVVSVSDTGNPIPENHLDKILMVGKRFTTFGTNNEPGIGTGLMISKSYIELHKGTIWFNTEKNGKTTFYFTIPKGEPEEGAV